MEELKAALRVVIANNFLMYFKTHSYHWNVEGMMFSQFHDFFGDLYQDLQAATDSSAEELRALGEYAPISLMEMYNYKTIQEDTIKPSGAKEMLMLSLLANSEMINSLNKLFELANTQNEQGLADYAAGRIDTHKKHAWMLNSYLNSGA